MGTCNQWRDPTDAALHAWGLCRCALYQPPPPRRAWTPEDMAQLLGLMGFQLHTLPNGGAYAHDPRRELFVPDPVATGRPAHELDELVIQATCADRLAGPLTAHEARARLAPLGIALVGGHQGWRGWVWEVRHAATDWRSDAGFNLAGLVETARSYLHGLGRLPAHQPVLEELTALVPKLGGRKDRRRAAARPTLAAPFVGPSGHRPRPPRPVPVDQLALDVFAGGTGLPVPEPPSSGTVDPPKGPYTAVGRGINA